MQYIDLLVRDAAISTHFDDVTAIHVDRGSNWFDNFWHTANEMLPIGSTDFESIMIEILFYFYRHS